MPGDDILDGDRQRRDAAAELRALLEAAGAREAAAAATRRFAQRAASAVAACSLPPRHASKFEEFARYVETRTW